MGLLLLLIACCSRATYSVPELDADGKPDADGGAADAGSRFPGAGNTGAELSVTGIVPGSGPFSGGTRAIVRGSAFQDGAVVRIGGRMVEPSFVTRQDKGRLSIVLPAGEVGPADVEVMQGDDVARLHDGFVYNALSLSPDTGSLAGGTLVDITVSGATFVAGAEVGFDGMPCLGLQQRTPKVVRCKTPAHGAGSVDVSVRFPGEDVPSIVAIDAYRYADTADVDRGGLSGGPLAGALNVTVVDTFAGLVLPGAFVIVGEDPATPYQGYTDARGAITFAGDDLTGPVTVHATRKCFERSSIVRFDAQNVTLFMTPIFDLSCADDGELQPGGHGQLASVISGELIFPGADEFLVNAWDVVPAPRSHEVRVAYVFTTQGNADTRNTDPGAGDAVARIEEATAARGSRGYPYRIFARPAGLAVYALAGLERTDTGELTPYMMGVRRDVVTSPGDETTEVDVSMVITLDRELTVALTDLPAATTRGPTDYRVSAFIDLGGEGVIAREVAGVPLDTITRYTAGSAFRFLGQPAFTGALADASYLLVAGYYTAGAEDPPYTRQRRYGVAQGDSLATLGGFLGIPDAPSPAYGGRIPADRTLRFELGGAPADLLLVEIIGGDGQPAWSLVLPGAAREVPVPDLSVIDGQPDIAKGVISWRVTAMKLEDFDYDSFQYAQLSPRGLTHSSANAFTMRR